MNHNSIRKWLPFSLICVLVLAVLVLIPFPAHAAPTHYAATFSELQSALTQVDTNGTIYITASFDITDTLIMPYRKSITIQSSGGPFTLSRGASHNADMIQVPDFTILTLQSITINGALRPAYGNALFCSGTNGILYLDTGTTITNNIKLNSYDGGVFVWNGGTCNMYNGVTISNNTATNNAGGGVFIQGGTFNMYGGTITGNTAFTGGGVSVSNSTYPTDFNGTFNMYGGTIGGNNATRGGVAVRNGGTFNMSGGVVTGNGNYGVYWEDGSVNLSGNPQIGTSISDNSLYRAAVGQIIGVSDAALGNSAFINVATRADDAAGTVIAQKSSANFTAAEEGYLHYLGGYRAVINPSNQRQVVLGATNASVNPTTATFDKYAASANYVDVPTTLTPGSYALSSVTLGGTTLTAGTHYTVSGNMYTFKKEYLATLGTGAQAFTFVMNGGTNPTFTVTVSDSTPAPVDASITPTTATFDKYAASAGYADVSATLTPGSYALSGVTLGGTTLTAGTHYTVSGNMYTFKKEYLATLGTGAQAFTFVMNGGTNPTFTVTVSDSTPAPVDASITPTTATFDKYAASVGYMDVSTTLTPGSYALSGVTLGGTTLTAGTHYTVSGNTYTFLRGYLATLGTGAQTFAFVMNGGTNPTFTVTVSDSTPAPTDASVSPSTATFDKYAASVGYVDVPTTLTPGSYALNRIELGGITVSTSNYTVSGNVYTFKKEYLATLGTGAQTFTFVMNGGTNPTFTVTVGDSTPAPVDASINPITATFDKYAASAGYMDVSTTLTPGSYALNRIELGGITVSTSNYTVSGNVYTFKKEYLATLGTGAQTFAFVMNGGANPTFTVTVSDSTPAPTDASVNPATATFDKYAASMGYADVPTTLTPGSYSLSGVTLGGNTLTSGTHYTVSGGVYTFKKEYLATLGTGAQTFTFVMNGGANPTFTVTVSDSTPAPTDASVSPTTAAFDKYAASVGYIDVPTTLTPGSYTLNSITLGGNTLTAGSHYTVSGGVYTFKKEYLATLGTGAQTFTFVMNGGTNPTFTATVSDSTPTTAASANVLGVTISGTVGSALGGGQRATITLTGDTVAGNLVNVDASGWFTGLPVGITVTANASAGGSTITLTFGGTPTAPSTAQFNITIPGNILTGGSAVAVAANPNARFSISGTPQPPSSLPKTGDGFPLVALMALLGAALVGMGWLGARLRRQKKRE